MAAARRRARPRTATRPGVGGRRGFNPHDHNNAGRGRRAERRVKDEYEGRGWKMERTDKPADFVATRGRRRKYVEVKTGSGKMNPRQKKFRSKVGRDNYVVEWRQTRRTAAAKDWSTTGKKRSRRAGRRKGGTRTKRKGGGFSWS